MSGRVVHAFLPWLLLAMACGAPPEPVPSPTSSSVPAAESLPGSPRYAERFRVEARDGYRLVQVDEGSQGGGETVLVLVERGSPRPDLAAAGLAQAQVVEVPVRTVVTTSTTEIPHLVSLGLVDRLVGHGGLAYVSSPEVRRRAEEGKVRSLGTVTSLDLEALIETAPDLVLLDSPEGPGGSAWRRLQEAGIPVAPVPSYLESSPLGRAEWIVYTALFFQREERARELFEEVARHYEDLQRQAATVSRRPTVLTSGPLGDIWYVPGGRSFAALFLADAGAEYLWAEDSSRGSLARSIEAVYAAGLGADFWLAPADWPSLDHLLAVDERFAALPAVASGRVYNSSRRSRPGGGNDYWETGTARPDLVLADLIHIFHPELLPDHELIFYRRLGQLHPPTAVGGEGLRDV